MATGRYRSIGRFCLPDRQLRCKYDVLDRSLQVVRRLTPTNTTNNAANIDEYVLEKMDKEKTN